MAKTKSPENTNFYIFTVAFFSIAFIYFYVYVLDYNTSSSFYERLKDFGNYHWGSFVPLIILILIVVVFKFISKYSKSVRKFGHSLYEFLVTEKPEAPWKDLKFFYIPGYLLFSQKAKNIAKDGPNKLQFETFSIFIFFIITLGFVGFFSQKLSNSTIFHLNAEWYKWNEFPKEWIRAYALFGFSYVVYVIAINIIVLISLFIGSKIETSENLRKLLIYFNVDRKDIYQLKENAFWSEMTHKLDNIYGHKLWSGSKTKLFIEAIQEFTKYRHDNSKDATSIWFLLDSASNMLEKNIYVEKESSTNYKKITIKTEFENVFQYSAFLSNTMQYCRDSMIWIVDQYDLEKYLLPLAMREVIISITVKLVKDNGETDEKEIARIINTNKFGGKKKLKSIFRDKCKEYCLLGGICNIDTEKKCRIEIKTDSINTNIENYWAEVVSLSCFNWAIINYNKMSDEKINSVVQDNAKQIIDDSLNRSTDLDLPHVRKFKSMKHIKRSRILNVETSNRLKENPKDAFNEVLEQLYKDKSGRDDRKKIIIEGIKENTLTETIFKRILYEYFENYGDSVKENIELEKIKKNILKSFTDKIENSKILQIVFEMLEKKFNGDKVGFSSVRNEIEDPNEFLLKKEVSRKKKDENGKSYDIGIFDKRILVNSIEVNDGRRLSNWVLLGSDEIDSLNIYTPTKRASKNRNNDKENFLSLRSFIEILKGN